MLAADLLRSRGPDPHRHAGAVDQVGEQHRHGFHRVHRPHFRALAGDRSAVSASPDVASATTANPVPDLPSTEEQLGCYSGSTRAGGGRDPTNVDELRAIFAHARENGRRVTLRAGAHSFDGQSLGDDLVVSMLAMNTVEVLAGAKDRVEPGARWGAILAKLKPLGLVPAVTVTTEDATAGGTLSGDCLSRFSPAYGKEGE